MNFDDEPEYTVDGLAVHLGADPQKMASLVGQLWHSEGDARIFRRRREGEADSVLTGFAVSVLSGAHRARDTTVADWLTGYDCAHDDALRADEDSCELCKNPVGIVTGDGEDPGAVIEHLEVRGAGDLVPTRFCEDCVSWVLGVAPAIAAAMHKANPAAYPAST